jgi:pyruvate kinase
MRDYKKTKIIATLGPAIDTPEMMEQLIKEGVNVFRVNFSHADYDIVKRQIKTIRSLNKKLNKNTAILADLQGPKLRVGKMEDDVVVNNGDEIIFTSEEVLGNASRVYMNYLKFPQDVKVGEFILLDDGKLKFEVLETNNIDEVKTKVIVGGYLRSNKGVNLPNTKISLPALTKKDKKDAIFAIDQKVDWIALSFVRNAKDLKQLNELIAKHSDCKIPVIAKIEKPEAVKKIKKIIANCDGLMVARGDLGVEIPMEQVPLIQKDLVLTAKKARIPIVIATQMMETMMETPVPSRAEVNDVANSVMDGADAVMLSGETSVGKFPLEVIKQMTRIIKSVENSEMIAVPKKPPHIRTKRFITKSVCYHAALISDEIEAKAITTLTVSGYTAFQISAWRPKASILVYSNNRRLLAQLSLLWGVSAFYYDHQVTTDETIEEINEMARQNNFVDLGDKLINLTAMPVKSRGMVNTLRISEIEYHE